jgi:hypothetical protein
MATMTIQPRVYGHRLRRITETTTGEKLGYPAWYCTVCGETRTAKSMFSHRCVPVPTRKRKAVAQ